MIPVQGRRTQGTLGKYQGGQEHLTDDRDREKKGLK